MTLLRSMMRDGSRHFASLAETYDAQEPQWDRLRDSAERLTGAKLAGFVTDHVTEAWIDFAYEGHHFSINNQHGEWWFFVSDSACADEVLLRVVEHFRPLLEHAR